jgi:Amino acid synthesis
VSVPDAPRPGEVLLLVGYTTGPRPNARSKGPSQADVDALIASFD